MSVNAQLEDQLHRLFNTHRNDGHGHLDLHNFDTVFSGLGLQEQAHQDSIRKWKDYYSSQNKQQLTLQELRDILGWRWAYQPVQVVAQQPAIQVIQQPAPTFSTTQQITFQQPKQEIFIEVIGPPPSVDAWLLQPTQAGGGFGDHFASFHLIMKEIEQIELAQEARIRATLQGFQFGTFSPKLDLLTRLVDYCKVLRSELNALSNHDYNITQQYNQLVAYIQQYQAYVLYLERRENYYTQMKMFEQEVVVLAARLDALTVQYNQSLITISDLRAQVAALEEKVRMIKFFQKIIIIQAFENMQHKSDIQGYVQDLQGLHSHYRDIFAQIQAHAGSLGGWQSTGRISMTGLREACQVIVENGLMANQREQLSGEYYLEKPQARAIASIILELDHDAHVINHDHVQSYISSNTFENEWLKSTSGGGRIIGRQNIMNFFSHVIEHRYQMTVMVVQQPPQYVVVNQPPQTLII